MFILGFVHLEHSIIAGALFDTLFLAIIAAPFIYIWVIRPFVVERDHAITELMKMAMYDQLTRLPNRRMLQEYLKKSFASNTRHHFRGALLLLDLDGFKSVNDSYGHDAGDAVLVEVAKRLQEVIRTEDIACRLGGDEFIIVATQMEGDKTMIHENTMVIVNRILETIQELIFYQDKEFRINASIGIRLLGFDMLDEQTALKHADIAMYQAKASGKGRAVFYDPEINSSHAHKIANAM